mmetsp:Transcript_12522/g.20434  ORF Transcript_12522/g.20434 Transcript_12522/m.20434 type:complete len:271 (-) Transcript_12522:422-1234(-)
MLGFSISSGSTIARAQTFSSSSLTVRVETCPSNRSTAVFSTHDEACHTRTSFVSAPVSFSRTSSFFGRPSLRSLAQTDEKDGFEVVCMAGRPWQQGGGKREEPTPTNKVNEKIRSPTVRVIGADGEMLGVMSISEAMDVADSAGVDLVEISPGAEPPVVRVIDYGKFRYEQQKKAAEQRKKQKQVETKEIRLRPGIETNDYLVKLRAATRFLEDGNKIKVTMRFQGREVTHQGIGLEVLQRMQADLIEKGKVEFAPKLEGRQMTMILGPK